MKLFSCFDTNLKQQYIDKAYAQYGTEQVVVVTRDRLYFFLKVILRIVTWIMIHLGIIALTYYLIGYEHMLTYSLPLGFLIALIFYIIAWENYIDYSMNYAIFTPHEATLVEQQWIFKRNIRTLDTNKIKSLNIKKSTLLYSIFNSGMLNIISEWSDEIWEINFKYVHNPESIQSRIKQLILNSPNRTHYHNIHSL